MDGAGAALPVISLSEAQAYVRVETGEEEAILAGLVRTASGLCEAFLNQVIIAREFAVAVPASSTWQRLTVSPVRSVGVVERIDVSGAVIALPTDAYAIDIDAGGDGWVRLTGMPTDTRILVRGTAGMASTENEVPEPIRQGVVRLVGHLFNARDGAAGDPPAAVTALWRPYRRMRLT